MRAFVTREGRSEHRQSGKGAGRSIHLIFFIPLQSFTYYFYYHNIGGLRLKRTQSKNNLVQDGSTPLHSAARLNHLAVVVALLQAGASVEAQFEVRSRFYCATRFILCLLYLSLSLSLSLSLFLSRQLQ
jgi:hypothetical protein